LDRDTATGDSLTSLGKLTATKRRGAGFALCDVGLEAGTMLEHDTNFAHVLGEPDNRWTPVEDFTAPTTGTHRLTFREDVTWQAGRRLSSQTLGVTSDPSSP
jgi:hypothetical protein